MKIVSWNILQGGGRRLDGVAAALTALKPDLVALQEVREGRAGPLRDALAKAGLGQHYLAPAESLSANTLMVAGKHPIEGGDFIEDRTGPCHMIEAETDGLTLIVAHFPQKAAQVPLFDALLADSASLLPLDCLILGDLNCGIPFEDSTHKTFVNAPKFKALLEAGWVDLYRHCNGDRARDYSWFSPRTGRGFRYDHALASPAVANRVSAMRYHHEVREAGHSDHSAMVIDLS